MTRDTDVILVPWPRRVSFDGIGPALSTPVEEIDDPALPAQGFTVTITDRDVRLVSADAAGRRYGRQVLRQLRDQSSTHWPAVRISDSPDFPVRGYMLDVSRGRVPTRATLERIVGLLESLRINHLQLYTEHTFAYGDHEVVWRDASPLTGEDIRWLDDLCAAAGIELVANQNCFGHMEHWLRHDAYRHRAESPDGFEIFGAHRDAMTLAPTADNARFALGLLDELLPHFRSDMVNIGCDETWELGRGASAADAAARGKGRVYLDYLNRLLKPLRDKGFRPQFWGDIITDDPGLVPELETGGTAVGWSYEAPWTPEARRTLADQYPDRFGAGGLSVMLEGFAPMAAPFAEAGYPFWVAPGTSTWTSLIGRLDNAYGNLLDTVQVGLSTGAGGVLITDWGDRGHLQPPSVSFPPLVYGASVAWNQDGNADLDPVPFLNRFVFDDATGLLGAAMDVLGRAWNRTGQVAFNCSPLQAALVDDRFVVAGTADPDRLADTLSDLERAIADIERSTPTSVDGDIVKAELISATRLARHGGRRLLRATGATGIPDAELRADLAETIPAHRDAWLARSRPGGMARGFAGLEATLASYG